MSIPIDNCRTCGAPLPPMRRVLRLGHCGHAVCRAVDNAADRAVSECLLQATMGWIRYDNLHLYQKKR